MTWRLTSRRTHASAERDWVIPPSADAKLYVEPIKLTTNEDADAAVQKHIGHALKQPLDPQRMFQVQSIRVETASAGSSYYLLWRFSHTAADGVILSHIMSKVLCDPPTEWTPAEQEETTDVQHKADPSSDRRAVASQVNLFERVWSFLLGLLRVSTMMLWIPDDSTIVKLGPTEWKRRGGASKASWNIGVSAPVNVNDLKQAAKRQNVTVNDILLMATGQGLRSFLDSTSSKGSLPKDPKITAVVVVNPRPAMPQANEASAVLDMYSTMKDQGCDITLGFVRLPTSTSSTLQSVARTTRRLKLSPETTILRLAATIICRIFGVGFLTLIYTFLVSKFTTYFSNVVAPQSARTFCGVEIKKIFFCTAPLDFGISFNFLSFNGSLTLCVTADTERVPKAKVVADEANMMNRLSAYLRATFLLETKVPEAFDEEPDAVRDPAEWLSPEGDLRRVHQ